MTKKITTLSNYPCQWDDLDDAESLAEIATIYTLAEVKRDEDLDLYEEESIREDRDDGVFDIVVDAPELTAEVVQKQLNALGEMTGEEYVFVDEREEA